ncbi:unnamed protein product [Dicrocoelium dendriticum]|nr:unnamed protein product [Dicrocoelium dendriticum]
MRHVFYAVNDPLLLSGIEFVSEHDYHDVITKIWVSEHYAAACGPSGQLILHLVDPVSHSRKSNSTVVRDQRVFPSAGETNEKITGFQITGNFLIYATNFGGLRYFHLEDWDYLSEFVHTNGIVNIFPNPNGTRVACIDQRSSAFIYNPLTNHTIQLPDFAPTNTGILWDDEETENLLLVAFDNSRATVYRYFTHGRPPVHAGINNSPVKHSTDSTTKVTSACNPSEMTKDTKRFELISGYCKVVGVTRIPYGHVPVALSHGELCLLSPTGRLIVQQLATHAFRPYSNAAISGKQVEEKRTEAITKAEAPEEVGQKVDSNLKRNVGKDLQSADLNKLTQVELQNYFDQAMRAGCFSDASVFAEKLNNPRLWNQLGMACLRVMQFDTGGAELRARLSESFNSDTAIGLTLCDIRTEPLARATVFEAQLHQVISQTVGLSSSEQAAALPGCTFSTASTSGTTTAADTANQLAV